MSNLRVAGDRLHRFEPREQDSGGVGQVAQAGSPAHDRRLVATNRKHRPQRRSQEQEVP